MILIIFIDYLNSILERKIKQKQKELEVLKQEEKEFKIYNFYNNKEK